MLGISGYEDGTVPVPFSRGPRCGRLVRRESGTGTKAANSVIWCVNSISLLWSQSHFHDSVFSLSYQLSWLVQNNLTIHGYTLKMLPSTTRPKHVDLAVIFVISQSEYKCRLIGARVARATA